MNLGLLTSREWTRRAFLGIAALTAAGYPSISTSKEEFTLQERLKSMPKGKISITEFTEILAGVGKNFPHIIYDAHEHKPPIGIDLPLI